MDADGATDLVVSRYGRASGMLPAGEVVLYRNEGAPGAWSREPILSAEEEIVFPAETATADLDQDGDLDVVVSTGWFICGVVPGTSPCGGMLVYEQTESGWTRHDLVPPENERFFHTAQLADFDGDGLLDLMTVGETWGGDDESGTATVLLYGGKPSAPWFSSEPHELATGLGSIPNLADLDGDGDLDLYGAQYFQWGASFAWLEQVAPPTDSTDPGTWAYHVIDDGVGKSIDLQLVPDLRGAGPMLVGTNHTNTTDNEGDPASGIFAFAPAADPTLPWSREKLSAEIVSGTGVGAGAPGVFGHGDVDGDGDVDLLVSGDGAPEVYLLEQTEDGTFDQHVLEEDLGQAGGMKIVDLDGDDIPELITTGYEVDALYVYERVD